MQPPGFNYVQMPPPRRNWLAIFGGVCLAGLVLLILTSVAGGRSRQDNRFPDLGRQVAVGAAMKDVRDFVGKPDWVKETHNDRGDFEIWYVGEWEIDFVNGRVSEISKF